LRHIRTKLLLSSTLVTACYMLALISYWCCRRRNVLGYIDADHLSRNLRGLNCWEHCFRIFKWSWMLRHIDCYMLNLLWSFQNCILLSFGWFVLIQGKPAWVIGGYWLRPGPYCLVIPWRTVVIKKLTLAHQAKKLPAFCGTRRFFSSRESLTGLNAEPDKSSPNSHTLFKVGYINTVLPHTLQTGLWSI
jgi:hypothetical protein